LRAADIDSIKRRLRMKKPSESFVIAGEKGVGKTCLINTVLNNTPGVVAMKVSPGESKNFILKTALKALTDFVSNAGARSVIFWHKLFTFGQSNYLYECQRKRLWSKVC
jgi:AAA+ ATPase superfamily predicted ATPase